MLYIAALFVSLLSAASACRCSPPLWEGGEGFTIGTVTEGKPNVIQGNASVSYDANQKKIAAVEIIFVSGKRPIRMKVIQDFKKKKQYIITSVKGQRKCEVTPLGPWTGACVPVNATSLGGSYYGAGDDKLETTSYSFRMKGIEGYFVMTKQACIPVAESFTGSQKGTAFMAGVGFQGITSGIKDPSVFDVPSICSKVHPSANISPPVGVFRLRRSVY